MLLGPCCKYLAGYQARLGELALTKKCGGPLVQLPSVFLFFWESLLFGYRKQHTSRRASFVHNRHGAWS